VVLVGVVATLFASIRPDRVGSDRLHALAALKTAEASSN